MGFRFRKSVKVMPGVRLTFTHRGTSVRVGPRNVGISKGPSGTRVGASIPGTGISYSEKLSNKKPLPAPPAPRRQYSATEWMISLFVVFLVIIFMIAI